jgi:hypothetical protein
MLTFVNSMNPLGAMDVSGWQHRAGTADGIVVLSQVHKPFLGNG